MNAVEIVARCTRCYEGFTAPQLEGATGCPKCGCKGMPMHPKQDAIIAVNVHELRILGIWAEHYAVQEDNKNLDNAQHDSLKEIVNAICDRIRQQLAAQGLDAPLTLSAEVKLLQRGGLNVELYRDGREEVP